MTTLAPPTPDTPPKPTFGEPLFPWRGRAVNAQLQWIREHLTKAVEAMEENDTRDWGTAFARLGRECDEAVGEEES